LRTTPPERKSGSIRRLFQAGTRYHPAFEMSNNSKKHRKSQKKQNRREGKTISPLFQSELRFSGKKSSAPAAAFANNNPVKGQA
jgi:hypothetical protein